MPATSPTLVEFRMTVSPGLFEGGGRMLRADEGGGGAELGDFGAMFGAITESLRDEDAQPLASFETNEEGGIGSSEGGSGESVEGATVGADAQEGVDDAQGLPVVEEDNGSVVLRQAEGSSPEDDRVREDGGGDRVKSGQVAMEGGAVSRETASGVMEVRPTWGELRLEVSQNEGRVTERLQEGASQRPGATEPREASIASRAAQVNRDDARPAGESMQARNEAANARQSVETHHRAHQPANQTSEHRSQDDGGGRSDRESSRQNQPLPRERSGSLPPAAARAEQVDAAVRLEQATGQQASSAARDANPAPASPSAPAAPAPPATESIARLAPVIDIQAGSSQPNTGQGTATSASADAGRAAESPLTSRILRGLTAMVNQRGGSLTMRLDPPELGSLRVQMTINRGTVVAQIVASSAQAHGLLEKNLAMLRTALESHGLSVERLTVQLSAPSNQSPLNQQHQQQDGSGRSAQQDAHADAGEGRSRGRRDQDDGSTGGRTHDAEGENEQELFSRFIQPEAVPRGVTTR